MPELLDELVAQTLQAVAGRSRPEATYRVQFNAGFTFRDAAALTPYLHALGITHCYASPYLKARPGSMHGYDITDHNLLNPEVGSPEDYGGWVEALQTHGMGQILDIVPNHMTVVGNENVWWNDVLENGPASPYAPFFDIEWQASPRPELRGRVLVPVLGEPYGQVLETGQLQLTYAAGVFTLHYFDHRFPVAPTSYKLILGHRLDELAQRLDPESPALLEYQSILTALKNLPDRSETDPERLTERTREKEIIKRRLASLTAQNPRVRQLIDETLAEFNGQAGAPYSFNLLEELLDEQPYRLAFWRVATDEINYRRFFDINELAAVSMERLEVFLAAHNLVLRLLCDGTITGVRVDHVDGLFDPRQYLERLQLYFLLGSARKLYDALPDPAATPWDQLAGPLELRFLELLRRDNPALDGAAPETAARPPAPRAAWPLYVVTEKILTGDETLPGDWPTYGTSGYDFLNVANGLFVDSRHADALTRFYREWTQDDTPFVEVAYQKKRLILGIALASELHMLSLQLDRLAQRNRWSRDLTLNTLRQALREVIACFPVYRSYITGTPIRPADQQQVRKAIRRALVRNPALSKALFAFVHDTLLLKSPRPVGPEYLEEQLRFVGKFQQVTAPVMAKGVEDTAFYVYHRLLSLNEVGGDPTRFGTPPGAFHQALQERQEKWPWAFSTLSTHDTKRSEDVRARINVLSEIPAEWQECVTRWNRLNDPHKPVLEEGPAPDLNEEYLFYQTLVGAWPLEPCPAEQYARFLERVRAYMRKALHEAKVHSSWINPNEDYDAAMQQFIERVLDPAVSGEFLADFRAFQKRVNHYGLLNSLSQKLLQLTAPGVVDVYQGNELWDFSLVDPDNRRPVDYARRQTLLEDLRRAVADARGDLRPLARELSAHRDDGRIKLFVTWRGLVCRREHPGLFTAGAYVPLDATGGKAEHVVSFLRRTDSATALVAVPRLPTRLFPWLDQPPYGPAAWADTALPLPRGAGGAWRNVFTGARVVARTHGSGLELPMAEVCADFPVALLLREE